VFSLAIGGIIDMIQTYEGYFLEDGCFVPNGIQVKLPTRRRAIVNVFVEEAATDVALITATTLQDRIERINLILNEASDTETDSMTDNDWDEMLTLRSQTNTGLSRFLKL